MINADALETTISIAWVLDQARRKERINVGQAGVALRASEANIARIDSATETTRIYLNCLANQERLTSANEAIALAKETIVSVEKRVQAGRAPAAELARSQANIESKKLDRGDVLHELSICYHRLAAQWGATEPEFKRVAGKINKLPNFTSFASLN